MSSKNCPKRVDPHQSSVVNNCLLETILLEQEKFHVIENDGDNMSGLGRIRSQKGPP